MVLIFLKNLKKKLYGIISIFFDNFIIPVIETHINVEIVKGIPNK